ncbi:MAG: ankyrin repeat domain-containing protein [Wolbachia sp.]
MSDPEISNGDLDEEVARQERSLGRKFSKEERLMDYYDRQIIVLEHLLGREFSKEERLKERLAMKTNLEKEVNVLQLHCAAYMGDLNMVKECIEEKGADVNALARGKTALFCAAQTNHQHVMKYLIEKGGSVQ